MSTSTSSLHIRIWIWLLIWGLPLSMERQGFAWKAIQMARFRSLLSHKTTRASHVMAVSEELSWLTSRTTTGLFEVNVEMTSLVPWATQAMSASETGRRSLETKWEKKREPSWTRLGEKSRQ